MLIPWDGWLVTLTWADMKPGPPLSKVE